MISSDSLLVLIIVAANRGLDPGSCDINGSSNDGCADLDRRSDDRDSRIGYAKTSTGPRK